MLLRLWIFVAFYSLHLPYILFSLLSVTLLWQICDSFLGCDPFENHCLIAEGSSLFIKMENISHLKYSCQAKVGHLAHVVISHQNVSCRKISVNVVLQLKVCHARCHLCSHFYLIRHLQKSTFVFCMSETETEYREYILLKHVRCVISDALIIKWATDPPSTGLSWICVNQLWSLMWAITSAALSETTATQNSTQTLHASVVSYLNTLKCKYLIVQKIWYDKVWYDMTCRLCKIDILLQFQNKLTSKTYGLCGTVNNLLNIYTMGEWDLAQHWPWLSV